MGLTRSQISQRLVTLLRATGVFGSSASVFEASLPAENFLASGFTFPIAAIVTRDAQQDLQVNDARIDVARFIISIAASKVTEPLKANYLASGGSGSSQQALESTISALKAALANGFQFIASTQGFQGRVVSMSRERLVPAQGTTFDVCDLMVEAYDAVI